MISRGWCFFVLFVLCSQICAVKLDVEGDQKIVLATDGQTQLQTHTHTQASKEAECGVGVDSTSVLEDSQMKEASVEVNDIANHEANVDEDKRNDDSEQLVSPEEDERMKMMEQFFDQMDNATKLQFREMQIASLKEEIEKLKKELESNKDFAQKEVCCAFFWQTQDCGDHRGNPCGKDSPSGNNCKYCKWDTWRTVRFRPLAQCNDAEGTAHMKAQSKDKRSPTEGYKEYVRTELKLRLPKADCDGVHVPFPKKLLRFDREGTFGDSD